MSWKKPVFMLGAVLLCTSLLLAASTPPGEITATATQVAPAPVQSADAVKVPLKATKMRVSNAITATRSNQVAKGTAGKANPVTRAVTSATPVVLSRDCAAGEAVIDISILTDQYPSETTWDVIEDLSGTVVASGGPYADPATEYIEQVCVDPALCYTFTIYDSFGDGICCSYGDGHYMVYYEGALFCEGGDFGPSESCPFIGVDCTDPCEGNEPPHDLCENAEMVVGPYPVTVANDPTCATIDCEGVLDWVAVWYEVDLPYASNNLQITTCATEGDVSTTGIVVYNDCSDCNAYIIRDGGAGFITCDNGLQGYDMIFTGLPGPATVLFPSYFVDEMLTPLLTEITFDVFNPDMGACCVGTDCIGNMGEADCIAADGTWYQGEDCATFECPAPCEEDTLVINILTDNYASETTWDLYEQGGGLIASGDPTENATFYTWQVCLEYAGCYDFTIYDSYGDGICCAYGEGYYELLLNGVLAGSGGEFGTSETTQVGTACVEPTGACCVDMVCEETNEELECDALGGIWYIGETCPDFVCPEVGVGDYCEDPIIVNAPYPVTVSGTNVGMTLDCPGVLDWNAQWFYFELPYAENDVTITMCSTTDLYTAGIVVMDDCACDDYIIGTYIFADPCITLSFELLGPGNYYFPAYAVNAAGDPCDYTVTFDITEVQPCIIDCEENEGEGDCYENYEDLYNGGCNSAGYPFQTLECGDTICGTSGVFLYNGGSYREMDWFQFTLDSPGMVTWSGQGEFMTAMWLLSGTCDGGLITEEFASAEECTQITLTHAFEAGTYIAIIAPADWGNYPCGVKYEASFTCDVILGACCYNEGADCVNNEEADCDAMGGEWYIGEDCANFECPVPCTESQIDIAILTDSWGYETAWEITDHSTGVVICSGGDYAYASNTLYNERCCIGYEDCVDFTIYDSYGDGIYSPGGYTIMLDGVIVADTMGMGWSGSVETVENFGGGCVMPTGACCVEMVCVETNEELECDALDGRWYEDETCPEFECPDTCADFKVTAPYTSELMDTCGWGDECSPPSQYNDTEEITFEVEIPHAGLWNFNTCLDTTFDTWIALGTDCCLEDIGYNDDSCGLQSEIIVYLEAGSYFLDMEGYSTCGVFIFDVHEEIPCEIECPEGGMPESEPCGEDYNGGCNMVDPQFEPIACNDIICGTGWFDGSTRDTDWYEFVATNDDHLTFTVKTEFDNLFGLIEQINPGVPGCDNITGYLNPYLTMGDCEEASVEFDVVAGGTYYLFVGPQFTDIITCDMPNIDYYAILTGENCMCGDFDSDGDVDEDDFFFFLDAFGTCVGDDKYEEVCDFDGDECITLVDYQMWMQCYRDANGKDFVRPIQQHNIKSHSGSIQGSPAMLP